jgi:chaperonin cofactor prefoldin
VGKSEGLRAELDERSNILDEDKRTIEKEVADVHSELAFLQNILAALNQDKYANFLKILLEILCS